MRNLPWWNYDLAQNYNAERWDERAKLDHHPLDLEHMIKEYPLSKALVQELVDHHIAEVHFRHFTGILPSNKIPYKFDILINIEYSEKDKVEGVIHEIAHGVYRAFPGLLYQDAIERILNLETEKFIKNYPTFSRIITKEVLGKIIEL